MSELRKISEELRAALEAAALKQATQIITKKHGKAAQG